MGGVDGSVIFKSGQSDIKLPLFQLVSAHGPQVIFVNELGHFCLQNLSHNPNDEGRVVLITFARLSLRFLLVHLCLKFFVVQDALVSHLMGYENLQKVICHIVLVLDFFKLYSDDVFKVVVDSDEGIDSDPLLLLFFVFKILQSGRNRMITLMEECHGSKVGGV